MTDLRFAARVLAKNRGFTLVAALLLTLGIGANTVMFSALDAVVLRTLPVPNPEQLVRMVRRLPQLGTRSYLAYAYYEALRDHASTLASVFGYTEDEVAMTDPAPAEQVRVHLATPEFFAALGVPPLYGRILGPADNQPSVGTPAAVLSYSFWRKRFAGDPHAIGRTLALHRHVFRIVGIMPKDFKGTSMDTAPELWVPVAAFPIFVIEGFDTPKLELASFELAGRLKPGISRLAAQAECQALWRSSMEQYYRAHPDLGPGAAKLEVSRVIELDPLEHGISVLRDRYGTALKLLTGSVALLLLIVCSNLAGLVLARASGRRQEIAVRLAMGATRGRLARQMLVESSLLTLLGTSGGVLFAVAAAPLFVRALPPMRDLATFPLTFILDLTPNPRIFLFSIAVSALSALLFGLAPALAASRVGLDGVLREARTTGHARRRAALVVFQVALCTVLLAGASLLVRTLLALENTPAGFDSDHVVAFTVETSLAGYTQAQAKALRLALTERVKVLPGVRGVASASRAVMRGGLKATVAPEGQRASRADFLNTSMNSVSPDYFDAMGMRILAGRSLLDTDADSKPARVVANEAFVRRFFPHADPIGRRFGHSMESVAAPENQIVGVVSDAKYRSLREPMTPTSYSLFSDASAYGEFQFVVRTLGNPESVIQPVRRALAALDPALPFSEVHTLAEEVDNSAAAERLTATLASAFSMLAATLAAIGIYGLLAYSVAERRREIGIRMALGARPLDIGELIGRQALLLVVLGIAIGLAAALAVEPWLRSLLFGVTPGDPASLIASVAFVTLAAAAGAAVPAFRAVRIEPATALRQEN
jgi:predicted permease